LENGDLIKRKELEKKVKKGAKKAKLLGWNRFKYT